MRSQACSCSSSHHLRARTRLKGRSTVLRVCFGKGEQLAWEVRRLVAARGATKRCDDSGRRHLHVAHQVRCEEAPKGDWRCRTRQASHAAPRLVPFPPLLVHQLTLATAVQVVQSGKFEISYSCCRRIRRASGASSFAQTGFLEEPLDAAEDALDPCPPLAVACRHHGRHQRDGRV